jgi:hypothetical protein
MKFFNTLKTVTFAGAFCGSDALQQTPLATDVNKFELQSQPQLVTGCLSAVSNQFPFNAYFYPSFLDTSS